MARLTKSTLVVTSLIVASLALSACGTGGAVADARTSCRQVKIALKLERQSQAIGLSSSRQLQLQNEALSALLKATPAAARATSIDGSWNPLMTTINEAERVPLSNLEPSLTRLCQVADSSTPYL